MNLTNYLVCWDIDIEAVSPEDAAFIARQYQIKPDTTATVFRVFKDDNEVAMVDTLDLVPSRQSLIDEDRTMYTVAVGWPSKGIKLKGLFLSQDAAAHWAEHADLDAPWYVVDVDGVEG